MAMLGISKRRPGRVDCMNFHDYLDSLSQNRYPMKMGRCMGDIVLHWVVVPWLLMDSNNNGGRELVLWLWDICRSSHMLHRELEPDKFGLKICTIV